MNRRHQGGETCDEIRVKLSRTVSTGTKKRAPRLDRKTVVRRRSFTRHILKVNPDLP